MGTSFGNSKLTEKHHLPPDSRLLRTRLRRLRYHPGIRRLVGESRLSPANLLWPLFVCPGEAIRREIASMPGQFQLSVDELVREAAEAAELGVGGVILFGIPSQKDEIGSAACRDDGIVQTAVRRLRDKLPDLVVVTDVCFCEYTSHGHCGPVSTRTGRTDVDNDATLRLLGEQAVSHAMAGATMVAPSGMMDGMVAAIRGPLDDAGFSHLPILSYSAKYASAFYGPFREAAESTPAFGDRRGYQMDPAAAAEAALREVALDLDEGADMIMVKPALAYLDVIRLVHQAYPGVPLAAYNVSGEYSMVKAAARMGWLDERAVALEMLGAIHRAGAGIILTYWAKDVARGLAE